MGPSGSGKTSLVTAVVGFLPASNSYLLWRKKVFGLFKSQHAVDIVTLVLYTVAGRLRSAGQGAGSSAVEGRVSFNGTNCANSSAMSRRIGFVTQAWGHRHQVFTELNTELSGRCFRNHNCR
jgi:energy-coupling factor transporter ATP-binding protein EcfA2